MFLHTRNGKESGVWSLIGKLGFMEGVWTAFMVLELGYLGICMAFKED